MRNFIITSLCTLALSLLGAFGVNQNSTNLTDGSSANLSTTTVDKNDINIEDQQSLPSDDQANAAENALVSAPAVEETDTDSDISEETPDKNEDAKDAYLEDSDTGAKNNVIQSKAEAVEVTARTNNGNHYGTKNRQIIYKNVNLSNCKSVKDVVKALQKNGYTGITMNNVKNINSLKGILAAIQAQYGTVTKPTPAPTKAPAPTTKPAPTTTPAPTTKPAPTKAPAPTATPAPSTDTASKSFASEVLRLVNIERTKAGLSTYTTNSALSAAANKRAQEISKSFSHTRTNGTSFSTVLTEYGISFRAAGENIAYGQRTPQEVVTGWMNSPGHRANILNAKFNKIGIGVYQQGGVIYWTQEFTN